MPIRPHRVGGGRRSEGLVLWYMGGKGDRDTLLFCHFLHTSVVKMVGYRASSGGVGRCFHGGEQIADVRVAPFLVAAGGGEEKTAAAKGRGEESRENDDDNVDIFVCVP